MVSSHVALRAAERDRRMGWLKIGDRVRDSTLSSDESYASCTAAEQVRIYGCGCCSRHRISGSTSTLSTA